MQKKLNTVWILFCMSALGKDLDLIIAARGTTKKKSCLRNFILILRRRAKTLPLEINASIQKGMDGMTRALREFSQNGAKRGTFWWTSNCTRRILDARIFRFDNSVSLWQKKDKVDGLPTDLLYNMVIQFVDYGLGEMSNEKQAELKASMGKWQEKYWEKIRWKYGKR